MFQVYSGITRHVLRWAKPKLDILGSENNRHDAVDVIQQQAGLNRC